MHKFYLSVSALIVAFCASAFGQVVPFTDPNAYNLAATTDTTITFTGLAPSGPSPSLTISGVTFTALAPSGNQVEVIVGTNVGQGSNEVLTEQNGAFAMDTLGLTLPAGVTAVAFNFKPATNSSLALAEPFKFTVTTASNTMTPFAESSPGAPNGNDFGFVGFVSLSDPITSITMQVSSVIGVPEIVVDNVMLGTAIPEPATLAAGVAAVVGCFLLRRRRAAR